MTGGIGTVGALLGLFLAIVLIFRKMPPFYALLIGAFAGGLIGGGGLSGTFTAMALGAEGMLVSVLRILTSGILAASLMETGAAETIADHVIRTCGKKNTIFAIALASMLICAVGVFVDIAVITAAPIAIEMGKKAGRSKECVLLCLIGGGKAGNIISPNPNTIALAEAFGVDMTGLILENLLPAGIALIATCVLAGGLNKKKRKHGQEDVLLFDANADTSEGERKRPGLLPSVIGPLVVVMLFMLRPVCHMNLDPMLVLPVGGVLCVFVTGNRKRMIRVLEEGLKMVMDIAILLLGTGCLAGVIGQSNLQYDMTVLLSVMKAPAFVLAPLSGLVLAAATSSTTAGAALAANTFSQTLLAGGVPALAGAAMIHAGATVLDSLPHGSFFHATAGAVHMDVRERMKLIPYEAAVGMSSTLAAVAFYLIRSM